MSNSFGSIIDVLKYRFENGTASHAYIVEADRAILPNLLRQCAMIALCDKHGCGQCDTCRKVLDGQHLDALFFPMDGRTKLNVEDIEYLVEESIKRPVDMVNSRVFLLNASDSLQGAGSAVWQNKLLKTLEEPVGNTYIFIGLEKADSLYRTIQSRCQLLSWRAESNQSIKQTLVKRGYSQQSASIASLLSNGNINVAEQIINDNTYFDIFESVVSMLAEMQSTRNALQYVSALTQYKQKYSTVMASITLLLHQSILFRTAPQLFELTDIEDKVNKIADNYSIESCLAIIEMIEKVKSRLDNGGNYIIELDNFVIDMLEVKYRCRT